MAATSAKKKPVAKQKLTLQAAALPSTSTPGTSRHVSVEEVDDDDPTSVGGTLDTDSNSIIELVEKEGSSGDEDMMAEENEEEELGMWFPTLPTPRPFPEY